MRSAENISTVSPTVPRGLAKVIPLDQITFPKVTQGLAHWNAVRGDRRFPARVDIHPSDIKSLLPNVMLLRVLGEGTDYEFKIVGGRTVEEHGFNPLNWRIGQLDTVVEGYAEFLTGLFAIIRASGNPVALSGRLHHLDRGYRKYESVYLPLGTDRVDHILNVSDYAALAAK